MEAGLGMAEAATVAPGTGGERREAGVRRRDGASSFAPARAFSFSTRHVRPGGAAATNPAHRGGGGGGAGPEPPTHAPAAMASSRVSFIGVWACVERANAKVGRRLFFVWLLQSQFFVPARQQLLRDHTHTALHPQSNLHTTGTRPRTLASQNKIHMAAPVLSTGAAAASRPAPPTPSMLARGPAPRCPAVQVRVERERA